MNIKHIFKLMDEKQDELYQLLCSFIKIDSESFKSYGNEQELAEHIHDLCEKLGLESDIYSPLAVENFEKHSDFIQGRGLENRLNVTARWRGKEDKDELMLMAHTDTVEVGDLKNWDFDPFSGRISDGKIWGRGACDDKYALATIVFVISILKEVGFVPKANLLFSAYSDEEYGGSHGALASVLKYPCPRIVNMDGREGQIWHCGSGGQEVKYIYHTEGTVDSAKITADALPVILEEIEKFADKRKKELSENRFYKGTIIPETSLRYMGIKAGNDGMDLGVGEVYFVYYTDKTKEQIYFEFKEIEKFLAEKLKRFGIVGDGFKPNTRFFHYVYTEPDSEGIKLMLKASLDATGKEPIVCGSCLSDLSVISKFGSNQAFGFGCGRDFSKTGGAHQPNEFIECKKLLDYAKTIAAYIFDVLE